MENNFERLLQEGVAWNKFKKGMGHVLKGTKKKTEKWFSEFDFNDTDSHTTFRQKLRKSFSGLRSDVILNIVIELLRYNIIKDTDKQNLLRTIIKSNGEWGEIF